MRVVLTGPESVGKSILAEQLAQYYKGTFIREFAREYVEALDNSYKYEDVIKICKQQLTEYDNLEKYEGFCFFDTYLIITKVWFLHVFNKLPGWFEGEFKKRPVDLYLLCKDDLVWEADGVRENEELRTLLFDKYEQELKSYGFNYAIIKGKGKERLDNAIIQIDNYCKKITKI
ncbi:ATP-binding protein [Labilibacter sediminis]|nr:ATP-binding protein [Labilibacter sediminis]